VSSDDPVSRPEIAGKLLCRTSSVCLLIPIRATTNTPCKSKLASPFIDNNIPVSRNRKHQQLERIEIGKLTSRDNIEEENKRKAREEKMGYPYKMHVCLVSHSRYSVCLAFLFVSHKEDE
jgi:hypothetical protein